jgi:hypothetical protein
MQTDPFVRKLARWLPDARIHLTALGRLKIRFHNETCRFGNNQYPLLAQAISILQRISRTSQTPQAQAQSNYALQLLGHAPKRRDFEVEIFDL